ncbi:asparagine synthase [Microbacterium sp. CSI-V]|uniref:asparagine synthase n=1 Tax=unclassified Microbacterium TaxID=2609290 RepID=UPI00097BD87A|nr:asparagine synthase [Microbacterium sp. CSI-V]MXS74494.1 asparagine synthase [Microbacterium sp. TL13]ONI63090.1 asparagine synthase [Microbacterium sp. CSI-V]
MGRTKDAIAEGLSIATAAARLTVRNRILVETIARGGHFDGEVFAEFARETLRALAAEQDQAADRVTQQRKRAWGRFSDSSGTHDYRDRDTRNLRRRARQSHGVAKELRAFADDPERVDGLVAAARAAAWGDVEANLSKRLDVEGMTADADPDYATMRRARMDALRMVDLARLASQAKKRAKEQSAAAGDEAEAPATKKKKSTSA